MTTQPRGAALQDILDELRLPWPIIVESLKPDGTGTVDLSEVADRIEAALLSAGSEGDGFRADIGEAIRTQDNAITANPIFTVQQEKRLYGMDDGYADQYAWFHDGASDGGEIMGDERDSLEREYRESLEVPGNKRRVGYITRWEFVTACLTRQGCMDYIAANKHNLGPTRIYVESGFRNREWERLRDYFAACPAPSAGVGRPVAWSRTETIFDDKGVPIGSDVPEVRWQAEYPDPDEDWRPLYRDTPPASAAREAEVLAMVDRFLAWRFPEDFAPDGGISYTPLPRLPEWTHDTRPTGTNLLTAIQARAMLEYVLAAQGGSDK